MAVNSSALIQTTRPPFLILTPICIFLGFASILGQGYNLDIIKAVLIMVAGLSAHISVNTLNEFSDYKSGLDFNTQRTPFSGGSGALVKSPDSAQATAILGLTSLLITALIGAWFALTEGLDLILLGLPGLVIILSYTKYLNRNPWLCLIAPGFGFGPLMIMGTERVLTGHYSLSSALISLVPFFLVNNLLLLNQLPDIEPDRQIGRRHFAIVFGIAPSVRLYALQLAACFIVILWLAISGMAPWLSFIALLPLGLAVRAFQQINPFPDTLTTITPAMGMNVGATLLTPLVLGLTLLF